MTLVAPTDREFRVLERGHIRDNVVLGTFREGLRRRVNPRTGQLFTEEEIAAATQPGSRWYVGAQAIDDYGQARQRNALWLADQIRAERASSQWLVEYHGRPIGVEPLPPTGGSGTVQVEGVPGTLVLGSTVLGNPSAYSAKDAKGNVYQAFIPGEVGVDGTTTVTLVALTAGAQTNIPVDTTLTWIRRDPNMTPTCRVVGQDFRGGTNKETDSEYLQRIVAVKRWRPGAGNDAQYRAWATESSNAIGAAFVYPCALRAGSVMVALLAKRAGALGPEARIPNLGTLAQATTYLVPPLSPVVPPRVFVIALPPVPEPTNLVLRLGMQRGTTAGWVDATPFPKFHATTPQITNVVSPTVFDITCPGDATLPNQAALATVSGANAPRLMVWHPGRSQFISLTVDFVQDQGSNVYRVELLSGAPSGTVAVGRIVSPDVSRRSIIHTAIEEYFDELGPGELFDTEADPRGHRCVRFPEAAEEAHYRAGAALATRVIEALGGSASDAVLDSISKTAPSYPTDILDGPNLLTLGTVGLYEI